MRDGTPSKTFKPVTDTPPLSTRGSPVINSSRNTPHSSSSRGSPARGSTPPVAGLRGATPPVSGLRSTHPPTSPPRLSLMNAVNGMELKNSLHPRTGRLFNLDTQLAVLRKEMVHEVCIFCLDEVTDSIFCFAYKMYFLLVFTEADRLESSEPTLVLK